MSSTPILAPLALAAATFATGAAADARIGQEPAIREGLIATGIAYEISEVCRSIDARLVRGIAYLESLRAEARRLGYSNDQIEAFLDDKAAARQLEAEARARLVAMGAVPGDSESHCAVGRAEIEKDSAIGRLLR